MSMKAVKDIWKVANMVKPVASTATTTGTAIDLANYNANTIVVVPGLWTDGTHTISLTESADNTTFSAVAAADLVGSFAAISSTATATIQQVSYIGTKRYIKHVNTVATATTGAIIGVQFIGSYRKQP